MLTSHFEVDNNTEIADFGCGPGLYANREAAEKGLNVHYVLKDYLDFETTNRFDLITMIMCDFCALSPEQRKKCCRNSTHF